MTLAELQKRAAAAIMAPLTRADGVAPQWRNEADALIKPNSRMAPLERLQIYSRSYWFRILDCLYDDFPGLSAAIGRRAFNRLSRAYLTDRPSQSFSLRNLGEGLEQWLREHPQYAGRHIDLALDMVRLEWSHIEAFDGPERKPLGPEDLSELGPDLKLALQPYLTLLELKYPVDDLRIAVNRKLEEHDSASNAIAERDQHRAIHGAIRRYRSLKPRQIHLSTYRAGDSVWYRRLDAGEFHLLKALREGLSIGDAIEKTMERSALGEEQVQQWFAAWAHMGWLCSSSADPWPAAPKPG